MHGVGKKLGIGMKLVTEKWEKKLGSENTVKQNLSGRAAVKYFQILGEKSSCLEKKIPYLCNHSWPIAFLFCLASSIECRVHHSDIVDYLLL